MLHLLCATMTLAVVACSEENLGPAGDDENVNSGGGLTVYNATSNAFTFPAPGLSGEDMDLHMEGDAAFEATYVTFPAVVNPGLGPVYNNTSCVGCHARDGRGRPPEPGDRLSSMLFRISSVGSAPQGGPQAVDGFGTQLQDRAVIGRAAEGRVEIVYTEREVILGDGSVVSLREPTYRIVDSYRPLPAGTMLSPRVAPPMIGLGLLEAVPDEALLALADASDRDGDGISGRPNMSYHVESGEMKLGRFGWKAATPGLRQQTAGAFSEDMGITSSIFPQESCQGQPQWDTSGSYRLEANESAVTSITHYARTLGVPARRMATNPTVRRGRTLFMEAGCGSCHLQTLRTGQSDIPQLANQTIHPYTDLLLHDMGEGLADNRPDFTADGREWRTAPLWGIGLTRVVNGHTYFLHDGRARSLIEAILWHGGEAGKAREYVRKLNTTDRGALIAFLESL